MKTKVLTVCVAVVVLALVSPLGAGLEDGLVARWDFSGNALDTSGNGNHGTEQGGVARTTDRFGNPDSAYSFDGATGYIDVADAPSLNPTTNAITITAWFRADSFALGSYSWPHIVDKDGSPDPSGYCMTIQQVYENNPCAGFGVTGVGGIPWVTLGVPILTPDVWYFSAGVWDGTEVTVYVGNEAGLFDNPTSVVFSGDMVSSSNNLNIGRDASYPTSTNRFFDGVIDDIRIYDRALSSVEIAQVVPEPATLGMLSLGGLALLRRRQK